VYTGKDDGGNFNVHGHESVSGNLYVTGATGLTSLSVSTNATVGGALAVTGNLTAGNANVGSINGIPTSDYLSSTWNGGTVTNDVRIEGNLDITGYLNVGGTAYLWWGCITMGQDGVSHSEFGIPNITLGPNGTVTLPVQRPSVSDERLKSIINEICDTEAIDLLQSVRCYRYTMKEHTENGIRTVPPDTEKVYIGVLAQELQQRLPETVTSLPSGYLGVLYEALVPPLIAAVKYLVNRGPHIGLATLDKGRVSIDIALEFGTEVARLCDTHTAAVFVQNMTSWDRLRATVTNDKKYISIECENATSSDVCQYTLLLSQK
jgi:hypothetical protein